MILWKECFYKETDPMKENDLMKEKDPMKRVAL